MYVINMISFEQVGTGESPTIGDSTEIGDVTTMIMIVTVKGDLTVLELTPDRRAMTRRVTYPSGVQLTPTILNVLGHLILVVLSCQ